MPKEVTSPSVLAWIVALETMNPNSPRGHWPAGLVGWICIGLVLASGCGVEDYEQRMQDQEKRLERFDKIIAEEAKYLGDTPLDMPRIRKTVKKDKKEKSEEQDALPFDFFLLPPKGIKSDGHRFAGNLYVYEGAGSSLKLYLAEESRAGEAFRSQVVKSLGGPANPTLRKEIKQPLWTTRMEMHKAEFTNSSSQYAIYFWQEGKYQIAVAFQVAREQAEQGDVKRSIEASLLTLAIGARASRVRSAYNQIGSRSDYLRLRMQPPKRH